jgi:peptidoglycan/LPS O-acetylase OafA/YrhL
MEGLRGIAVTLVFLVHYCSLFGNWLAPRSVGAHVAEFLSTVGHSGVDLFFVLSGYLIYGAVISARDFSYARFMQRRLWRIYPTFLCILAIYLALCFLLPSESKLPREPGAAILWVLENALLLPGMFSINPLVTVAWSLSYEVFFYAFIPLLVAAMGLRDWGVGARLWTFGVVVAAFLLCSWMGIRHVQLAMFASGIFVYELTRARQMAREPARSRLRAWATPIITVLALPVAYLLVAAPRLFDGVQYSIRTAHSLRTIWLLFALGTFTRAAFQPWGLLPQMLSAAPLRWLGNMSYSYYLVHGLTLKVIAIVAYRVWPSGVFPLLYWGAMPAMYACTLVIALVLFASVEKPLSLTRSIHPFTVSVPALAMSGSGDGWIPRHLPLPKGLYAPMRLALLRLFAKGA